MIQGHPVQVVIVIVTMTVVEAIIMKVVMGVMNVITITRKGRTVLDIGLMVVCICQGTVYRFLNGH